MIFIVSPGQSIQAAIVAASPGDTIVVRPGTYNQSINVPAGKDRLRIIGAGAGQTIIDGTGLVIPAVTVTLSPYVTFAGFTVQNSIETGITVLTDNNVVRDNQVTQSAANGIRVQGSNNLIKDNTLLQNTDDGIFVDAGPRNAIIGNKAVRNGGEGIDVDDEASNTLVLRNETCENEDIGIEVEGSGSWVAHNQSRENGSGMVVNAENVLVYANEVKKNTESGLIARGTGNVVLRNHLNDNGQDGATIIAESLAQSLFYRNEMSYNTEDGFEGGVNLQYNLLLRNDVDENGAAGIDVDGGDLNRLLDNDIDDNANRGIDLDNGSNFNVIDHNLVDDNQGSGILVGGDSVINLIRANKLNKNRPFDIEAVPPAATNNIFDLNECKQSSPSGLCS